MSRDKQILIFLVLIWAAALAYNYLGEGGGVKAPSFGRVDMSGAERAGGELVPTVRLDLLKKERGEYGEIKRDIFTPLKIFVPKPPPKVIVKAPAPAPVPVPEPEPVAPRVPTYLESFIGSVTFVGFMQKDWDKTVFLSKGEEIFLVRVGDLVEGRVKVVEITDVMMRFVDNRTGETSVLDIGSE